MSPSFDVKEPYASPTVREHPVGNCRLFRARSRSWDHPLMYLGGGWLPCKIDVVAELQAIDQVGRGIVEIQFIVFWEMFVVLLPMTFTVLA